MRRGAKPAKRNDERERLAKSLRDEVSRRRRLQKQLAHARDQRAASSAILKIISRASFELEPVLTTVVESATRLCAAQHGHIFQLDGAVLRFAVGHGTSAELRTYFEEHPVPLGPGSAAGQAAAERRTVHLADVTAEPGYQFGEAAKLEGWRTVLAVPLLGERTILGVLAIWKTRVEPFTDEQIAMVQSFADQAVIAIENVRLFRELTARNGDLAETLEQQTATSEILRVISRSPTDVGPVFDAIAQSALRLCEAQFAAVFRFDGTLMHFETHAGGSPDGVAALRSAFPRTPQRGAAGGRAVLTGDVVHIPDVHADPEYALTAVGDILRSTLAVPMVRAGVTIGTINVARFTPGPFSDRQIALLKTFADQAVIAIENVRLFAELQSRNRELIEALEQQTATSEVLKTIS